MKAGQRGVVVITAILVVALVAGIASFIAWQVQLRMRQSENMVNKSQSQALVAASLEWIGMELARDGDETSSDHLGEPWAKAITSLPVDGARLSGSVSDQQGLFNLNNLGREGKAGEADLETFRRLLTLLKLPSELAAAVADWVDADGETRLPGGAEDSDYLRLDPPYLSANRALDTVDALYRIKGFAPEMIERLRPFVTALPVPTAINVNTAPAEVLAAAVDGLTLEQAREVVSRRNQQYFAELGDFRVLLSSMGIALSNPNLDVKSRYFQVKGQAAQGRGKAYFEALIERRGSALPVVVWRKMP